ncbi:MAG: hypothetical protein ACOCUU_01100 [Nanoarchaeota archaeon]
MKKEIPHTLKVFWLILGIVLVLTFGISNYLMQQNNSTEEVVFISNFYIISMYLLVPYFIITIIYLIIGAIHKFKDVKKTIAKYPSQTN